jgi:hypothetical protein
MAFVRGSAEPQTPSLLSSDLPAFLRTVKGAEVEGRMEKALAILRDPKVEIFSPDDLAMAKISSVVNCYENAISSGLCNYVCTWCALGRAASFYVSGLEGFLNRAIAAATELANPPAASVAAGSDLHQVIAALPSVKKEEPKIHVDLGSKIDTLSMAGLISSAWPSSEAVDHVATEVARLMKRGIAQPFIYVILLHWLPHWAELKGQVRDDLPQESEQSQGFQARSLAPFHL